MCHKSDSKGNQYKAWKNMRHSKAFEILKTDEAKKTAEGVGVTVDPSEAPECLKCHTTAFGVEEALLGTGFNKEDGVQCETCHGAGGDYYQVKVMKDPALSKANGLITPSEEVCLKCHNEDSPNYIPFNFEESYKKIYHPRP